MDARDGEERGGRGGEALASEELQDQVEYEQRAEKMEDEVEGVVQRGCSRARPSPSHRTRDSRAAGRTRRPGR